MKPHCFWLLSAPGVHPQTFCNAPVPYTIERDDDDRPVRRYAAFCEIHQKLADALPDDDES